METDVQARIRERAYAIWLEEGCPHGRDTDHWLRAERDIARSLTETAPVALATAAPAEEPADVPPAKPKRTRSAAVPAPKKGPEGKARKETVKKAAALAVTDETTEKTETAVPKTPRTRRKASTAPA